MLLCCDSKNPRKKDQWQNGPITVIKRPVDMFREASLCKPIHVKITTSVSWINILFIAYWRQIAIWAIRLGCTLVTYNSSWATIFVFDFVVSKVFIHIASCQAAYLYWYSIFSLSISLKKAGTFFVRQVQKFCLMFRMGYLHLRAEVPNSTKKARYEVF